MKKLLGIFLGVISLLASCKKDNCKDSIISIQHFETDYGCTDTKHSLLIDLTNNVAIIRSKTDYDSRVSGICHPDINFSTHDLVIGKQVSGNWIDTITYDLKLTCPKKELTLTVDIIMTDLTQPDNVVYHAIIPKLGDEETLSINVNVR